MAVDWAQSAEGYDSQLVVNHLGPFLFTNLIMGKLLKSPAPRIVNVTSGGHRLSPFRFEDYNFRVSFLFTFIPTYPIALTYAELVADNCAERRVLSQVAELRPVKDSQYAYGYLVSRETRPKAQSFSFQRPPGGSPI